MRKLKLDIAALQVDSFVPGTLPVPGGTVHGRWNRDPESTECDGGGWFSLFGTCEGCPTVGTCVGPTYCCPPTWRPTCNPSCNVCTDTDGCPP
jgi:hypothetical protein